MALKRDFYRALEDILGPDYVSEDPVITETYANPVRRGLAVPPRFAAITLPNSTEQVQAIVRLCNRFKVQFKAASTSWLYSDSANPECVKIDLRRMNKIIEINEKSLYAVVEPYVIGAQLQAECMKRGLNCNLTGAGSNCSALPLAAHVNLGHLSQSGSYGERNQLALEWVTGDGEIVKLGSLGSNGQWFCGDGPGPSLRGIVRGNTTPLGGLGVYTKAAQKLYPWPGPATFPMEGISPKYKPAYIPAGFLCRYFSFKDLDTMIDAVMKIGEAEIAAELMCFNAAMMASNLATKNIEEEIEIYNKFKDSVLGPGFMVLLAGNSPADFDYKKLVLQTIIDETGGKPLQEVDDPENQGGYIWRYYRETGSIKETGRILAPQAGMVGGGDSFPLMSYFIKSCSRVKEQLIKEGVLMDDGISPFIQSIEHGHTGHGEVLARISIRVKDPREVGRRINKESNDISIKEHFGVPQHVWSDALHDLYGPHASNYHLWMRKVKKTFDPNAASESSTYINAKE
ncbi:MAG TPA: FAD-binding oxidoreductase [Dehalococcoidales bacterium]|nr:FAD-binding oxidoreductase [Dehalococcoidales bacterium]